MYFLNYNDFSHLPDLYNYIELFLITDLFTYHSALWYKNNRKGA